MTTLLRYLPIFILAFAISIVKGSTQPLKEGTPSTKLAGRQVLGSFDPVPAPGSILLVGGGLLVLSGILRRRLRGIGPNERKIASRVVPVAEDERESSCQAVAPASMPKTGLVESKDAA
jgi:hypothetical protein